MGIVVAGNTRRDEPVTFDFKSLLTQKTVSVWKKFVKMK